MTQVAVPSDKPPIRRILSIDGGGIMGTQPASFLTSLEEDLDRPIGEYFDLIAGTSTGGILAIGLAMGLPARDLLDRLDGLLGRIFRQLRIFRHMGDQLCFVYESPSFRSGPNRVAP